METIIIQNAHEMIQIVMSSGVLTITRVQLIIYACIAVAFTLAVYFLMAFGLMRMARKREMKHWYFGFIPFVRYLLVGELIGKTRFFNMSIKNAGLITMIVSMVFFIFNTLANVLNFYPLVTTVLQGKLVEITIVDGAQVTNIPNPYSPFVNGLMSASQIIVSIVQLVLIFFEIMLFMELFKKYSPQHYFLFSLLAVLFSVEGIIVFCLRNKQAVNYNDYIKERYMRMQGEYTQPRETPPDNPFREFGARGENDPGDPFAEFGSSKDKTAYGDENNNVADPSDNDKKNGGDDDGNDKKNGDDDDPFGF